MTFATLPPTQPVVTNPALAPPYSPCLSLLAQVLSDDNKRAIYDKFGEAGLKGDAFGGMGGGFQSANPMDIFESFFGSGFPGFAGMDGMGGRPRERAGDNEQYELQIDFLDAVFGCKKELEITHLTGCKTCSSSGVKQGTSPSTCTMCQGTGQLIQVGRAFGGGGCFGAP